MVSTLHETLLRLFRDRLTLAPELLQSVLDFPVPAYTEIRMESADLTQVTPTEYRADLVLRLVAGRPVLAIVLEVQIAPDADKRFSWPEYLTGLRARMRCDCLLFVVTSDGATARWAAAPIELGHPGFVLKPLVLGPDAVPIVVDATAAAAAPELAVLSVVAHANGPEDVAVRIAKVALDAVVGLDEERASFYNDFIVSRLGEAARAALEALMLSGKYEYQTEFAKKHIAIGRAQGEAKGEANAILEVLSTRGIEVPDAARDRILACADSALLLRWIRRAVTVASADELFA
jgi:hypothetical protein